MGTLTQALQETAVPPLPSPLSPSHKKTRRISPSRFLHEISYFQQALLIPQQLHRPQPIHQRRSPR
ncbi:MAG: hypothetical protein KC421_24690, partial [Anaerolineales bacterium]|nr:hypothetical protein [Anaerolineales bacterium]